MKNKRNKPRYIFDTYSLYKDINRIAEKILVDFGGGSPLSKTVLMASLVFQNDLKNYVEIGVYRGRSFFPLAFAIKQNGGMAYGIDPYELEAAKEYDLSEVESQKVNSFLDEVNLPQMYSEVVDFQNANGFADSSVLIRNTSKNALGYFVDNHISIDILHIDGNHDTKFVQLDADLYIPLVKKGGFIVFDDINFPSVKVVFNQYKEKYQTIFNDGKFAILYNYQETKEYPLLLKKQILMTNGIIKKIEDSINGEFQNNMAFSAPLISVIVPTYNHQSYIAKCLDGILAQKGNFKLELIIGDDYSTDGTLAVINKYCEFFQLCGIRVDVVPSTSNIGVVKNYERCLRRSSGDFIAICEGDDFWIDCYKLQKNIDFMREHPECSFCFNKFNILYEEEGLLEKFDLQEKLNKNIFDTRTLVKSNFIGNFSCCFYDGKYLHDIPADLFNIYTVDWMFNLYYSQFGKIGYLDELLSIYRKHKNGAWSGKTNLQQVVELHGHIDDYNKMLNFTYTKEFVEVQRNLELQAPIIPYLKKYDLLIFDDVFPHPMSPFRYQEYTSYLKEIDNTHIVSSGQSTVCLGTESLDEILINFKRKNPNLANKVTEYSRGMKWNSKLLYTVFLNNIYYIIEDIEKSRIPFIFTLYPGGGFGIDNETSDMMLKRVTSSPFFIKVIATQKITYDYLIEKGFCTPDKVEYIYGIVTPNDKINQAYPNKKHFGFEKDKLDIVFGAYRYTSKGVDKGYDVFINVAKILAKEFHNVHFHVIGGFDENDIDVKVLKNRITFYGVKDVDWFDEFFMDKDIILSPNIHGKIYKGSFDGFPTGTCTEAAFRETAIFCTDDLGLNQNYINGQDLVVISHDQREIVEKIKYYMDHPDVLRTIGQNGRQRVNTLYGYNAQILPRIKLIKKKISLSDYYVAQNSEKAYAEKNIINKPLTNRVTLNNIKVRLRRFIKNKKNSISQRLNRTNDIKLISNSDLFDREWYLAQYPDVAQLKINPALHYLIHGGFENRNPSPYFSSEAYLQNYPDIRAAKINPLLHYIKWGQKEVRRVHAAF